MFSWKKSHNTKHTDESVESRSKESAHIELKEEPKYPNAQDTIELKDLPESKSFERAQGVFELKPESSAPHIAREPALSLGSGAKVDSGEHEKYVLLFDLDGTLLDSIDGIYHSFTHACGVEFSPTSEICSFCEFIQADGGVAPAVDELFKAFGVEV